MPKRVVVVGAGINGLVAANYLRRAGFAVTMIERSERVGGACVSEVATVNGQSQRYALGASVLGLMQDFVFRETGLADRLETFVPDQPKRVYFPDTTASAWIYRDPGQLQRELATRWGERGDVAGFRADEARVVAYLQDGYRRAVPPSLAEAELALGAELARLWITGSAADLLDHYFTADHTKIYMGMTVTESGPVSLHEPYSAFTLPLMDSGSIFDGYYGFVREGIWRVTEELAALNRELGVDLHLASTISRLDIEKGELEYDRAGTRAAMGFDHVVFATDPLTAARLVGVDALVRDIEQKRFLGTSGKLTLFFREPVRWLDEPPAKAAGGDTAFRFIFAVDSLADFEAATLRVVNAEADYAPGLHPDLLRGRGDAAARRRRAVRPPNAVLQEHGVEPAWRRTAGCGGRGEGAGSRARREPGGMRLESPARSEGLAAPVSLSRREPGPHHAGRRADVLRSPVLRRPSDAILCVRRRA